MLVCAFLCASCTRDRGCSAHPAFPAPSHRAGQRNENLGSIMPRECETASLSTSLRGALATKQSIPPFARLDGLLRGACHPAALRADRVARNDPERACYVLCVVTRACGASSTPRHLGSTTAVSGILDRRSSRAMTGALWKDNSIHVVPDKRAQRAPIRDPYAASEIVLHTGRWLSFNELSRWSWSRRSPGRRDHWVACRITALTSPLSPPSSRSVSRARPNTSPAESAAGDP